MLKVATYMHSLIVFMRHMIRPAHFIRNYHQIHEYSGRKHAKISSGHWQHPTSQFNVVVRIGGGRLASFVSTCVDWACHPSRDLAFNTYKDVSRRTWMMAPSSTWQNSTRDWNIEWTFGAQSWQKHARMELSLPNMFSGTNKQTSCGGSVGQKGRNLHVQQTLSYQ